MKVNDIYIYISVRTYASSSRCALKIKGNHKITIIPFNLQHQYHYADKIPFRRVYWQRSPFIVDRWHTFHSRSCALTRGLHKGNVHPCATRTCMRIKSDWEICVFVQGFDNAVCRGKDIDNVGRLPHCRPQLYAPIEFAAPAPGKSTRVHECALYALHVFLLRSVLILLYPAKLENWFLN